MPNDDSDENHLLDNAETFETPKQSALHKLSLNYHNLSNFAIHELSKLVQMFHVMLI